VHLGEALVSLSRHARDALNRPQALAISAFGWREHRYREIDRSESDDIWRVAHA
jgi:hypothetical protein